MLIKTKLSWFTQLSQVYLSVGEDLAKGAAESPEKARKFMNTS